jgi:uncharacterized protein (DUF58 family)
MERGLNLDVAGCISDLENGIRDFEINKKLYKTLLRGKGLDFDGYRLLGPDDDAANIDWKASKRANKLLTKQYIEERNVKVMFIVDVSDNMVFGSSPKLKCELAAEIVIALSHLIIKTKDKVGIILFNNKMVKRIDPLRGDKQFNLIKDILSEAENYGGAADTKSMTDYILNYVNRSVEAIFIVSDFLKINEKSFENLRAIGSNFETVAIMIKDPLDKSLPEYSKEIVIENPSTKEQLIINPKLARKVYSKSALEQEIIVKEMLKESAIDLLYIMTNDKFVPKLAEFLRERISRKGVV